MQALRNTITNKIDGCEEDMKVKNARYIGRNIELNQEFSFAHPKTKFKVNLIWNSHFSGHVLWDLFCREAEMIENTWNVSFRKMYSLPRNTRKFLVEPVSQSVHIYKESIYQALPYFCGSDKIQ